MNPLLIAAGDDVALAHKIAQKGGGELADVYTRSFPDGELYLRIDSDVSGRDTFVVCSLYPPSEKLQLAYLLASTARDLGAKSVRLLAPYLSYLRQDRRFQPGEGVTSAYVASWLSGALDELVAVDPHLHRYDCLSEVYAIPTRIVNAAPAIAEVLAREVEAPVIVGPDAESEQWVAAVASQLDCPSVILEKTRRGDRDVSVSTPAGAESELISERTPVLVDDIISTGHTMVEALHSLGPAATRTICVGIHPVFAGQPGEVEAALRNAGARAVLTCNTIPHPTNAIDLAASLAAALGSSA